MPETDPLFFQTLPSEPIRDMWARVALMGRNVIDCKVSLVNVGSEQCPVPMFLLVEPEVEARPCELILDEGSWLVLPERNAVEAMMTFCSQQAIFEITPKTADFVIGRRCYAYARHPKKIGEQGRYHSALRPCYVEALSAAGLLAEGPWTEAHEAAIDAYDQTLKASGSFPQNPEEEEDEYLLDPLPEDEE